MDEKTRRLKKMIRFIYMCLIIIIGTSQALAFANPLSGDTSRFAMSYVYYGANSQRIKNVTTTNQTITTVAPDYFNLNSDGTLNTDNISDEFINAVKQEGIKVVPYLSNNWDQKLGIAALNDIDNLSDSIVSAINLHNLDGVNTDIENVTPNEKDKYVQLVAALRQKLAPNKEVSVAVAANPYAWTLGWHGSYDYKGLSQYADYIFIMAYDEHYSGGAPGPVASIEFVEKSIEYAAKHVPKEKIVLGIPFYGRIWSSNGIKGQAISLDKIAEITSSYDYNITYDDTYKSPKMEFVIKSGDTPMVINGRTLGAAEYTMWYENPDSIKEKLALVSKYDIKGAGNWSAGQETDDVWDYYKTWLNGKYFSDISYCFAKDDIQSLSSKGIINGISKDLFAPEQLLSRAEAAAIITRIMGLNIDQNAEITYSDTSKSWAKYEIEAATKTGILKGYEDKSFMPDSKINRAEMAAIISRILNLKHTESDKLSFEDVDSEFWAYNDIAALKKEGIINGYPDNTFKPLSQIKRAEGAAMINRAINKIPD